MTFPFFLTESILAKFIKKEMNDHTLSKTKTKNNKERKGCHPIRLRKEKWDSSLFFVLCSLFFALFVSNYDKLQVGWALG